MIYFDNAATSVHKPKEVSTAMLTALEYGNAGRGAHGHALLATQILYNSRKVVSAFFCTNLSGVVFSSSATNSINTAVLGLFSRQSGKPLHIISTVLEHNAVLRPLYYLQHLQGLELSFVGVTTDGDLQYSDFEKYVQHNTKAVVITAASNVTGLVPNLKTVSSFCKKHGLLLIVDAAQSAGLVPISMEESGIDVLVFTGHKSLLGPPGTGGMCIAPHVEIQPQSFGGTGSNTFAKIQQFVLPDALEVGTQNIPGIAGLAAGIEYITQFGITNICETAKKYALQFYEGISQIEGVHIYTNISLPYVPIITFNIRDMDSEEVAFLLSSEYGISVRGGFHCAPLMHDALGTVQQGAVRFSFSHLNTCQEVDMAVHAVMRIAKRSSCALQ